MFSKSNQVSESTVCRAIYERHEVLQGQVLNLVLERFQKSATPEQVKEFAGSLGGLFSQSTDGLVTAIGKEFAKK